MSIGDYITGERLAAICDYQFNPFNRSLEELSKEIKRRIPVFYVKTDYISQFYSFIISDGFQGEFSLLTHNSDFGVSESYNDLLQDQRLVKWFAQNVETRHSKLISIPIGIANSEWPHGNLQELDLQVNSPDRERSIAPYVNFSVETNLKERSECLITSQRLNLKISERLKFAEYLKELKNHYFCFSPNGNGIDCHKTWEALYLGVCPIVTRSINSLSYSDYPILFIDSWKDFSLDLISEEKYLNLWKNFDKNKLNLNYYESLFNS